MIKKNYGHYGEIESLSFSFDSEMIDSGSRARPVKIWHWDGIFLNTINVEIWPVYSVSFSRDQQKNKTHDSIRK